MDTLTGYDRAESFASRLIIIRFFVYTSVFLVSSSWCCLEPVADVCSTSCEPLH